MLRESKAFVDSIWWKIWKNSQYQMEEVMNQIAYLKYLQAVFKESDLVITSKKDVLIQYFQNSFHLSIKAQLDGYVKDLDKQDEAIEKAINVETKASQQPSSSTREIDA